MFVGLFMVLCGLTLAIVGCRTFFPINQPYDLYRPIVLFIGGYIVGLILAWIFVWLFGLYVNESKNYEKPHRWARFWLLDGITYINHHALAKVKITGGEKIPRHTRFLLVCNHRSKFDPMLISEHFGKLDIAFITKSSNMKIPLGHRFMHRCCYLPIEREDKLKSLEVMNQATKYIQADATSIGVFPEGKRQDELPIKDFHEGCFNIALHAKCPIVVMTIQNTENIHRNFPFKFTRVKMHIVKTMNYDDFKGMTAKDLSDHVYEVMYKDLTKDAND